MIITLVKADFSAKNIGTLSSFAVLTNILNATYDGPTSIEKGSALSATITLHDGYSISAEEISISMGGEYLTDVISVSGSVVTIEISEVTGVIVINMAGYEWTFPVVEWFDGSLASATGNELNDAGRVRTGYIALEDIQGYITVPYITATKFIVSCYDADMTYLGQLSTVLDGTVVIGTGQWISCGIQITPDILKTVTDLAYIRVIANSENSGVQFIMNGTVLATWSVETEDDSSSTTHFTVGTLAKGDGIETANTSRGRTNYIDVANLTGTNLTVKECQFIIAGYDADNNYLGQYSTNAGDFDLVACQTAALWLAANTQVPIANLTNATTIRLVAYAIANTPYVYIDDAVADL